MENPLKRNSLVSMVSAPVIWAIHFVLSYVVVSLICAAGYQGSPFAALSLAEIIIGVLTIAAIGLLAYIAIVNYRKWRRAPDKTTAGDGISRFFALCSVMLSGLSAVALIWVAFPTFVLPSCTA